MEELSALQRFLYASNRHAVLVIFQAMDAAGRDGAIRHVMSGINPQGCQVLSFKHPSATELDHDFLWRTTRSLPERGRISIFNRSYCEEVLIVRVHPEILRGQGIPEELFDERTIWEKRYRSIVDLEEHLHRNGTRVIKFFLHLPKDEQRKRFLKRIDEPDKNWKFSDARGWSPMANIMSLSSLTQEGGTSRSKSHISANFSSTVPPQSHHSLRGTGRSFEGPPYIREDMMAQAHGSIVDSVICGEVTRLGSCTLDELAQRLPNYSPRQVFSAVDRLSGQGRLRVSRTTRFDYDLTVYSDSLLRNRCETDVARYGVRGTAASP